MPLLKSSEELFQVTRDLMSSLEHKGNRRAAEALKDGFSCLNGLTDGWAGFLDAIERVRKELSSSLNEAERKTLTQIYDAAYLAVYRRKREWWKFWEK